MSEASPYLFVTVVWMVETAVILLVGSDTAIAVRMGKRLLELGGLLLVTSTIVQLGQRYEDIAPKVAEHGTVKPAGATEHVDRIVRTLDRIVLRVTWRSSENWRGRPAPPRLRMILLLLGWSLHLVYLFGFGHFSTLMGSDGWVAHSISLFVIIPFLYYPVLAEFAAIIANVHLTFPARIREDGLLNMEDVSGYGGLRPVGRMIGFGARRYAIGVLLYTLITILRGVTSEVFATDPTVLAVDSIYIVVGVSGGFVLFVYPVFGLHRFMVNQKQLHMQEILEDCTTLPAPDTVLETNPDTTDGVRSMQTSVAITLVRGLRDYPVSVQQAMGIMTTLVMPLVFEYVATYLLAV